MARFRRTDPPPVSFAVISTLVLSSTGSSAGSSIGGRVVAKLVYDAAAAAVRRPPRRAGEADGSGDGYTIAVLNVPVTAWPLIVTAATLLARACARNVE